MITAAELKRSFSFTETLRGCRERLLLDLAPMTHAFALEQDCFSSGRASTASGKLGRRSILTAGRSTPPLSWSRPMIRKTGLHRDGQDGGRSGRVAPERRSRRLGRSSARLTTGADVPDRRRAPGLQKRHSASRPKSDHRPSPGRSPLQSGRRRRIASSEMTDDEDGTGTAGAPARRFRDGRVVQCSAAGAGAFPPARGVWRRAD